MKRKKILFVCHGNVGRSQMAEAFYNHFTKSNRAISAGIDPTTLERYSCPAKEIIQVMKEEGIDVSHQKVKTVTQEMVKNSDQIFIMCRKENCPDFLLRHPKITFWDIEDPYKAGLETTRKVRDNIKSKVLSILNEIKNGR